MGIWTPRAKPEVCKFTYTPHIVFTYIKLCALYGALYGNEVFNLFKLCALYGALYGLYGALYGIDGALYG